MALDHYVTLGRSGLRVSPLCLGTMTFGEDLGWGSSVKESQQILDRYLELGGNFLDTANFYTRSHSEKIIGDHIGRHKEKRDRIVIATKFSGNLYPGDPNGGGSGRKSIIAACEQSLRRLQTDYIDLYWLHNWDVHTPIEETMSALEDLVRSGKVRYLGVSDTPAWKIAEANVTARFRGWSAFIGLQIEYSLLERTVEQELMPMARELGLGVTPWSPLKSGLLSGKYTRRGGQVEGARGAFMGHLLNEKTFALVDELAETHSHFLEDGTYAVDPKQFHTPAAIALMHDIIAYTRSLATKPDNVREYTTVGDYVYQMLSKRKHSGKTTVKFAVKKKHDNFEHDVAPIELVFDGQWAIKIYPRNESIALRNFLNRSRYVLKDDIAPVNV